MENIYIHEHPDEKIKNTHMYSEVSWPVGSHKHHNFLSEFSIRQ